MSVDGSADNGRYLVEYTVNAYGTYKLGAAGALIFMLALATRVHTTSTRRVRCTGVARRGSNPSLTARFEKNPAVATLNGEVVIAASRENRNDVNSIRLFQVNYADTAECIVAGAGIGDGVAGVPTAFTLQSMVIPHHETFSTTIQPPYSSTKG